MGKPKPASGDAGRRKYSTQPERDPEPEPTPAPTIAETNSAPPNPQLPPEQHAPGPVHSDHHSHHSSHHHHHHHHHHDQGSSHHGHGHHHHHHHGHGQHSHHGSMSPSEAASHSTHFSDSSRLHHHGSRSRADRAQYDYVMNISQSKGRELLLKNKIQTIPVQMSQQRSRSDYDADVEESAAEESKSTVVGGGAKIRTIAHHAHLESLYGPVPEYERPSALIDDSQLLHVAGPSGSGTEELSASQVLPSSSKLTNKSAKSTRSGGGGAGGGGGCTGWVKRGWARLSDISESDRADAVGEWDYWKGYYCGEQSLNKRYKPESLSWAIMFVLGQCGFMELVHYVHKWGSAFLPIALLLYLTLGYSLYILEACSGQYSGRKPLQMLRYLCPSLSGLGGVLYLRTVLLAVRSLGIFLYSAYFAIHFLSCTINANQILSMFNNQTLQPAPFHLGRFTITGVGTPHPAMVLAIIIIMASFCVLGFYTINKLGRLYRITTRILTVILVLYFFIIWTRYMDANSVHPRERSILNWKRYKVNRTPTALALDKNYSNASIWTPVKDFFEFRWRSLVTGRIWIDAIVYVVTSLVLGTMVHPYLNSRSAFHYRSGRDGFLVVLYSIFINYLTLGSLVLWIAYISPNKLQITRALENLSGPYGMLIVYAMQHYQAQYTGRMETDILFWAGMFYASIGLASWLAVNGYIHILIHCSYQERTSAGVKVLVYLVVVSVMVVVLPILLLSREGIQHLIFIDFYTNRCLVLVVFTCGAYFWAVAYGHGLHKFVYDFRNMMHFDMFRAEHISARYSKYARGAVIAAILATLLYAGFVNQFPVAGNTDYSGLPAKVATGVTWLLCGVVILIGLAVETGWGTVGYTGRKNEDKRAGRPHRDWFKNIYHYKSCFIKPEVEAAPEEPEQTKEVEIPRQRRTVVSFEKKTSM